MSFITKLLNVIGSLFTGLFNEAKKAYKKLPQETKDALVHGSGIIEILNNNLEGSPEFVRELIKKQFPDLDNAKLESGLFELAHAFNLDQSTNSFEDIVKALQKYFNALDGKTWATISHSAASLLSVIFAPVGTKVAAIVSLIEYVYQNFIKKI